MGRKSAFTPDQWVEIEKRHYVLGQSINSLALEFGVNESVIRRKIKPKKAEHDKLGKSLQTLALEKIEADKQAKIVADQIAELPVIRQNIVNDLVRKISNINSNIASAAEVASATSYRLQSIANTAAQKIDDADPTSVESMSALKTVIAFTSAGNESAKIPLGLIAAAKESLKEQDSNNTITIVGGLPA